jgi:hypothetical protein
MKNYLFTPFKKKIEKINAFNELKSTIISCIDEKNVDTSYAITPLIIFVGQLESYYDAEICRLGEEHEHNENIAWGNGKVQELLIVQKGNIARIDELRIENNTLKLSNDRRSEMVKKLKADNKELKERYKERMKESHEEMLELRRTWMPSGDVERLKAELEEVKRCNKTMDGILIERDKENADLIKSFDAVREQNDDLRIDLAQAIKLRDKFGAERDDNRKNMDILKADNKRLNDKMGIKIAKEYTKEAEEYFHNNPQSKGIRFHMIDFNEYDYDDNDGLNGMSGEYNGLLLAEDSLIEIDNPHLK